MIIPLTAKPGAHAGEHDNTHAGEHGETQDMTAKILEFCREPKTIVKKNVIHVLDHLAKKPLRRVLMQLEGVDKHYSIVLSDHQLPAVL